MVILQKVEELKDQNTLNKIHLDIIISGGKKDNEGNLVKRKGSVKNSDAQKYKKVKSRYMADLIETGKLSELRSKSIERFKPIPEEIKIEKKKTKESNNI